MPSRFPYLSTYMQISDGGRSEKLGTLFDIIPLSDLFSILCKNGGARASSTPPSFTGPASTAPTCPETCLESCPETCPETCPDPLDPLSYTFVTLP